MIGVIGCSPSRPVVCPSMRRAFRFSARSQASMERNTSVMNNGVSALLNAPGSAIPGALGLANRFRLSLL
jgi:hypothetical protein